MSETRASDGRTNEPLAPGLEQAFRVACGELGLCSAAWLFVREVAAAAGGAGDGATRRGPTGEDAAADTAVAQLRDQLGRAFPVLDSVAARWLAGARGPDTTPDGVLEACAGAAQLVVAGLETDFLDVLVERLPATVRVALVAASSFPADWERVLANWGGRVEAVDLATFQARAGQRSVLLTFAYGRHGEATYVLPAWLRATGEDVRTQFRTLVAWDVLRAPMYVYPRWLVEVPLGSFPRFV